MVTNGPSWGQSDSKRTSQKQFCCLQSQAGSVELTQACLNLPEEKQKGHSLNRNPFILFHSNYSRDIR